MSLPPLLRSLKRLNLRVDRGVLFFYSLLFVTALFIFSIPFFLPSQRIVMQKFHLTLKPFDRWALFQFVPSMYNFKNEIFISFNPLNVNLESIPQVPVQHLTINHYPLRTFYFTARRNAIFFKRPVYLAVRSTFGKLETVTSYVMESTPQDIQIHFLSDYERLKN